MTGGGSGRVRKGSASGRSPGNQLVRIDHTHSHHQRRIVRAVQDQLARVAEQNERSLSFTEGLELGGLWDHAVHGCCWPHTRRVALVLSDRRLIEIVLSSGGRHAGGRIRSFPWDRVSALRQEGSWLELETWTGESCRWYLRDTVEPEIAELLRSQVDLAVSTYGPADMRWVPLSHCGLCGAARTAPQEACRRCGMLPRSRRLAAWLATVIPGAGHLYAGRPVAAGFHLLLEVGTWAATAAAVLTADTAASGLLALAVGSLVLGILKLQAVLSARLLARRAGSVAPVVARRWRRLALVAPLLAATALALPPALMGAADRRISWDLDFSKSDHGWTGARVRGADGRPGERSRWSSGDGLLVRVEATPFRPFESEAQARSRVASELGGRIDEITAGAFRALRAVSPGLEATQVQLAVVDPVGRDVHILTARVPATDVEPVSRRIERLLRRGIWVRGSTPQRPR